MRTIVTATMQRQYWKTELIFWKTLVKFFTKNNFFDEIWNVDQWRIERLITFLHPFTAKSADSQEGRKVDTLTLKSSHI